MFKYVSEIISQFSRSQKILALLILSFSIIVISIAPSFISAVTIDRKELENKISESNKKIKDLECEVNSLDSTVRSNQKICTDDAFKREIDFKKMLQEIQDELILKQYKFSDIKKLYSLESFTLDSTVKPLVKHTQESSVKPTELNSIIKKIDRMKKSINTPK